MDLYIGNLPYKMREEELRELLAPFGAASSIRVVTDRETGRSRGFAFATFDDEGEARAAIAQLNGREIEGRALVVNEAQPRAERSRGGGGGRGYGGDRGGYGGDRGGYGGGDRGGYGGGRGGRGGY